MGCIPAMIAQIIYFCALVRSSPCNPRWSIIGLAGYLYLVLFAYILSSDILADRLSLFHAVEQACTPGAVVVQIA
jgi:hypothetical protein